MGAHFFGIKDRSYYYSHSVGRNEFAGTGLRHPVDMAIAPDGMVYVANRCYEHRPDGVHMTVMTLDEEYVSEFGAYGEADGEFIWPTSVAIDSKGDVYVADEWLNRISKYNRDGEFLSKWGGAGSGDGELNGPSGLAFDSSDNLVIVDSSNNRVQKFTTGGKFISKFGSAGSANGQFNLPWGIAVDKNDDIYIADWRNDRVQVFNSDGVWQQSFGSTGSDVGHFNRPNGIAVDGNGDIFVTDWGNNRVQVFANDGRYITQFIGDGTLSKWGRDKLASNPEMILQRNLAYAINPHHEKSFGHPCAVKIDPQGRICVLDNNRGRIQVYGKDTVPVLH